MLNDYKSRSDLQRITNPRRGRRIGRILLFGLVISAALYASQSFLRESPVPDIRGQMASVAPSRIETRLNLPSPKVENASEDTRTSSLNIARSEDQAKASLAPIPTADPTSEQNQAATLHLLQPDIDPNGQPQQAVETGSSASELSLTGGRSSPRGARGCGSTRSREC